MPAATGWYETPAGFWARTARGYLQPGHRQHSLVYPGHRAIDPVAGVGETDEGDRDRVNAQGGPAKLGRSDVRLRRVIR